MSELFDANGNPIEAFTKDEVESKIEETKTQLQQETKDQLEDLTSEINTLKKEKEELLGKKDFLTDEDKNWANVRNMIKERDSKISTLESQITEITEGVSKKFDAKKLEDTIRSLSDGNTDIESKIRFHFDRIKPSPESEKDPAKREVDFTKRIEDAYILATGGKASGGLGGPEISSEGGFVPSLPGKSGQKLSEGGKQVGKKFGLTDDDLKNT